MENKIIHTAITKTGKTVSFRYPTIDDVQILTDYINKISAEKTFITFQGEQQSLEDETKWLKDKLEKINKNECVFIMAFIENKLVSSAEITLKTLVRKHIGTFGITVDAEYRGEGIGKEIMKLVINESIKKINNIKIIDLEVYGDNIVAQNLYKKMGFIEYGRLPESIFRLGNFYDAVLMYKKVK